MTKLYRCVVELREPWASVAEAQEKVQKRFLDARVEDALGFRGDLRMSELVDVHVQEKDNGQRTTDNKDVEEMLLDVMCCSGAGHTIRSGGTHVNAVQLRKRARWPYFSASNIFVPESEKYPLAMAAVCDGCVKEGAQPKYALAGFEGLGGVVYLRVPIDDLEDPLFYWPEQHPDAVNETGGNGQKRPA